MIGEQKRVAVLMMLVMLVANPVMANSETESETEREYTETDLWYLSRVIQAESGYCSEEMMQYVGSVVLNRVKDKRFPDSIEEVVLQPGQYSTASYLETQEPTEEVLKVAKDLLENGSVLPGDVIYQANFPQGYATYITLSTPYSVMYFCVG